MAFEVNALQHCLRCQSCRVATKDFEVKQVYEGLWDFLGHHNVRDQHVNLVTHIRRPGSDLPKLALHQLRAVMAALSG